MKTPEEIQTAADDIFRNSSLGQQLDAIYSTSDGRFFVRYEEAYRHVSGSLDKNTKPLEDKTIVTHFNPY